MYFFINFLEIFLKYTFINFLSKLIWNILTLEDFNGVETLIFNIGNLKIPIKIGKKFIIMFKKPFIKNMYFLTIYKIIHLVDTAKTQYD